MSKELKTNTFGKGLMMDLHPLNTPNTVLTDNLNGTIITYDGNEQVLQNDMGNYRLKDCKLRSNYIPIGLKEYAGILYIVSYNPLDDRVEIGTYPSPEIKTPSSYNGIQKELNTFGTLSGSILYSELEKPQSVIWYDEKLKINPGDYYKITTDLFDDLRIIKNAWFIMTEDKTLQEIELEQNSDDFVPVTWEYPGYLTFQQRAVVPTEFEAFVSQLNIPAYVESEESDLPEITDGKIGFELSLSKIDYNKITKDKELNDVVGINVTVTKVSQDGTTEILDTQWDNNEKFTTYEFGETEINIFGLLDLTSSITGLKKTDSLLFNIIPEFKDEEFSIIFDQYTISTTVNLDKIGTIADLEIGSEIYKFWRKNNTCYIVFDIASPTIVAGDVHLWYRLVDLNGEVVLDWTYYEDEVLSGENTMSLSLEQDQKEQIYILEFSCGNENSPSASIFNKPKFKKILITSVVFNEFVGSRKLFDQEILFPEWYELHHKYANYKNSEVELNIDLTDYVYTTDEEKEIVSMTNERYWNTTEDDAQNFTYSLAVKNEDAIPKLDYTVGYVQHNIPVSGNLQKLDETALNIGLWKINTSDIQIKIGNTTILCNEDGTFSSDNLSSILAKNVVVETMVNNSAAIPSVDKVFVNKGLTIEKTENGVKTVLENQQLIGHQYGAGGANSDKTRRAYDWAAENIIASVGTIASKMATIMEKINTIGKITAIGGGATSWALGVAAIVTALCSVPVLNVIFAAFSIVALALVGLLLAANAIFQIFHTERHLSWASGLYATKIETAKEIEEQFDKVEEGNYKENEKFRESLALEIVGRTQGVQWDKKKEKFTGLQNMTQSFLQQNQPISYTQDDVKVSSVVKNKTSYSCFPVLFQNYLTNNVGMVLKDGICIYSPKGEKYFIEQGEYDTNYSIWIAFMTPSDVNSLVYIPCTFDGMVNKLQKTGSIDKSIEKKTGAPTAENGTTSENKTETIVDVSKMLASAMVWCRGLFVVPEEGNLIQANFMEPVIPEIPDNMYLVFEYSCMYDYSKSKYLGKTLYVNSRIDDYELRDKVQNLNLLSGASTILNSKHVSDKIMIDITDFDDAIVNAITEKINAKLYKYSKFSEYCKDQINYVKLDPVITENTIRNGRVKGVYNTMDSYDAEGGLMYQLNQLSNLNGTLTYPKTDQPLRYYLCNRKNGNIGEESNQIFVTLGYNSKFTLDCSDTYFKFSSN